jgi:hypothetical protein
MKLSLEDAICIKIIGWKTDDERELFDQALEMIRKRAAVLQLERLKEKIDKKLLEVRAEEIESLKKIAT